LAVVNLDGMVGGIQIVGTRWVLVVRSGYTWDEKMKIPNFAYVPVCFSDFGRELVLDEVVRVCFR
jgi:hypothetical protein